MKAKDFGEQFFWGAAISAVQTEGFSEGLSKGKDIWETFVAGHKKLKKELILSGPNFIQHYESDIALAASLGLKHFRFSISWSRIIPEGEGTINEEGIAFYRRVAEACLQHGLTPWACLYHWDLPLSLEKRGGWKNREMLAWFSKYTEIVSKRLGDIIHHWFVLNEPTVFTGAGYFLGIHAPGKTGLSSFIPAMHHTALVQAQGIQQLKSENSQFTVGTTFSFTGIEAWKAKKSHEKAAQKIHALLNRLYLEPMLGMGYPIDHLPFLKRVEKIMLPNDEKLLQATPDFIGAQIYTREIIKYAPIQPYVMGKNVSAERRKKTQTAMGWEFYPEAVGDVLQMLSKYETIPPIIISENGVATEEMEKENRVIDFQRVEYHRRALTSLRNIIKTRQLEIKGYFIWSLIDNFEWAEGYRPRFGVVYVDHETGKRIPKLSASWWRHFLQKN